MDPARIAELLQPFLAASGPTGAFDAGHSEPLAAAPGTSRASQESAVLSPQQLQSISTYIDLLLRWNARINLTAVRRPEAIVTRHFGESVFTARHLFPLPGHAEPGPAGPQRPPTGDQRVRLIDLGSGSGFPGLPIKIWAPDIHLALIESNQKKATFLREVVRALTLMYVDVVAARAETLPPAQADVVTLRAVERFDSALPAALRLLNSGGRIALLIGQAQVSQATDLAPNVRWSESIPVPLSSSRVLLVGVPRTMEPT